MEQTFSQIYRDHVGLIGRHGRQDTQRPSGHCPHDVGLVIQEGMLGVKPALIPEAPFDQLPPGSCTWACCSGEDESYTGLMGVEFQIFQNGLHNSQPF